jgi:hypothetical protein
VAQAQQYIAQGYGWVIDLDLEKFFDRVNHDKLMGQIAKRVEDKRLLRLIRAFLNAGVMENGLVSPSVEGTPQGGPLSPLLSNLVLDELDQELERRGHRFVRYADDCNIYVRSERAGEGGHHALHHTNAQAQGKRGKERGGATAGTEVPRVRLHGRSGHQAHDRAEISGTVQATNPRHHAQGQGRQHHDDNGRVGFVYAGLARLFRLLRNAPGAHRPHALGPAAAAGCSLASVENTTTPPGGTCRKRGLDMGCKEHGRQRPRSMVSRPK